jgi:hypothetical protein
MTVGWQDLLVASAAIASGAWLFTRWLRRRRAKAGCDTCAAAMHARLNPADRSPKRS